MHHRQTALTGLACLGLALTPLAAARAAEEPEDWFDHSTIAQEELARFLTTQGYQGVECAPMPFDDRDLDRQRYAEAFDRGFDEKEFDWQAWVVRNVMGAPEAEEVADGLLFVETPWVRGDTNSMGLDEPSSGHAACTVSHAGTADGDEGYLVDRIETDLSLGQWEHYRGYGDDSDPGPLDCQAAPFDKGSRTWTATEDAELAFVRGADWQSFDRDVKRGDVLGDNVNQIAPEPLGRIVEVAVCHEPADDPAAAPAAPATEEPTGEEPTQAAPAAEDTAATSEPAVTEGPADDAVATSSEAPRPAPTAGADPDEEGGIMGPAVALGVAGAAAVAAVLGTVGARRRPHRA